MSHSYSLCKMFEQIKSAKKEKKSNPISANALKHLAKPYVTFREDMTKEAKKRRMRHRLHGDTANMLIRGSIDFVIFM